MLPSVWGLHHLPTAFCTVKHQLHQCKCVISAGPKHGRGSISMLWLGKEGPSIVVRVLTFPSPRSEWPGQIRGLFEAATLTEPPASLLPKLSWWPNTMYCHAVVMRHGTKPCCVHGGAKSRSQSLSCGIDWIPVYPPSPPNTTHFLSFFLLNDEKQKLDLKTCLVS